MKDLCITAIIEKDPFGCDAGLLEEFPEVLSQGKTIEELEDNLTGALNLASLEKRNCGAIRKSQIKMTIFVKTHCHGKVF